MLAAVVLVTATIALLRRWSGRVKRLMPRSQDAENILWFIVALYVSFFLLFGATVLLLQRALGDPAPITAQPFSSMVAAAMAGMSSGTVEGIQGVAWWAHVGGFLAGLVMISVLTGGSKPARRSARARMSRVDDEDRYS